MLYNGLDSVVSNCKMTWASSTLQNSTGELLVVETLNVCTKIKTYDHREARIQYSLKNSCHNVKNFVMLVCLRPILQGSTKFCKDLYLHIYSTYIHTLFSS